MKKLLLIGAGAIGYVLGAKAGRERYDQIAEQAQKLRNNPQVQDTVDQARTKAHEAADVAREKVQEKRSDGGPDGVSTNTTSNPTGASGPTT